jgi:hypothetical protein
MMRTLRTWMKRKRAPLSSKHFRPRLEALEDRWLPNADWWTGAVSTDWNIGRNWSLGIKPGQGDDVTFDGSINPMGQSFDTAVTLSTTTKVNSVTIQNGYRSPITINGCTLESAQGFNFDNASTTVKITFATTASELLADSGQSTFKNFQFTGQQGLVSTQGTHGVLNLTGQFASDTWAKFLIGGNLSVANTAVVTFHRGAGIVVADFGGMTIGTVNNTVLSDNGEGGIIENWGAVSYTGGANIVTEVDMAFLNHNAFSFSAAPGGNGGELNFTHASAATDNNVVKMDSGSFKLFQNITLDVRGGYYQTGGTFTAFDSNMNLGNSTAEIDGGNVNLGDANTCARLWINSGNLTFNGGEYDPKIQDTNFVGRNLADSVVVMAGNINIMGNSKLHVTIIGGNGMLGETWQILYGDSSINGDFLVANKIFPPHVTGPDPNSLPKAYVLYYTP